jgi:hypothetical protein
VEQLDLRRHSLAIQTVDAMQQPMLMRIFATACIAGLMVAPDASAQRRPRDQDEVFNARRTGQVMPLNQIEARVYRLKFMRGGSVFWVDVDGRTGAIVGRSGS